MAKTDDIKGISLREYSKFFIKSVKNFVNIRKNGGAACPKSSGEKYLKIFLSKRLKASEALSPYKSGISIKEKTLKISPVRAIKTINIPVLFCKIFFI